MPVDLITSTISPQLAEDTYVAVTDKIEDKLGRKGMGNFFIQHVSLLALSNFKEMSH